MAITVVQSVAHAGNPPATFSAGVTAGNTVFLVAAGYTTAGGSPSVSAVKLGGSSVTGTVAFFNPASTGGVLSPLSGGNGAYICIWMIPGVPGGGTTVDYTATGFNGMIGQVIYEVAGLGTSPTLDKSSSGGAASGTAVSSGASGNITSAPQIVFGATMAFAGTPATNSGWTCLQPAGGADLTAGYQLPVSSGSSFTWAQTSSGSPWSAIVATVAVSAPPPSPVYPLKGARPKLIIPLLTGRTRSSPGAPVNNPGVVPVRGSMPGAVRAALPAQPRGRIAPRSAARIIAGGATAAAAAGLALAAPPGTVTAGAVVAGVTPSLALAAPAGSAAAGAVVTGVTPSLVLGAPAGSPPAPLFTPGLLTASDTAAGSLTSGTARTGGPS